MADDSGLEALVGPAAKARRPGAVFACSKCGFKSRSAVNLDCHYQLAHSPSPSGYGCIVDQCGHEAPTEESLCDHFADAHLSSPSSPLVKVYHCSECPFRDMSKHGLLRHMHRSHIILSYNDPSRDKENERVACN